MPTPFHFLLQAQSQPAGSQPAPFDTSLLTNLVQQLLLVVILFVLAIVVIVVLMRSQRMDFIKHRRDRRGKPSELEDIWFENPIERKGIKPQQPSPDENGPRAHEPPSNDD